MMGISKYQYNLGVKGQGKIMPKSVISTHNMNSSFISTIEGVQIWHNDCLWGVDYNIDVLSMLCHWCQKTKSNILTISL